MREIVDRLLENHKLCEMAAHPISDYLYMKSKFIIYLRENCPNLISSDLSKSGKSFDIHNAKDVSKSLGVIIKTTGDFQITRYYKGENNDIPVSISELERELDELNNLA